jgi:hypothetical protein
MELEKKEEKKYSCQFHLIINDNNLTIISDYNKLFPLAFSVSSECDT